MVVFRQTYRNPRSTASQLREAVEASTSDAIQVVHKLLDFLLSLLTLGKQYIEISSHGTNKLVSYFQVSLINLVFKRVKFIYVVISYSP